jgi:hypothetical protein
MTVVVQGFVQTLVFLVLQLLTLFVSAGRCDIVEFWLYIVMIAAVSGLSLAILDPDLVRERMRPGGQRVGLRFLPLSSFCSRTGQLPASIADDFTFLTP